MGLATLGHGWLQQVGDANAGVMPQACRGDVGWRQQCRGGADTPEEVLVTLLELLGVYWRC